MISLKDVKRPEDLENIFVSKCEIMRAMWHDSGHDSGHLGTAVVKFKPCI